MEYPDEVKTLAANKIAEMRSKSAMSTTFTVVISLMLTIQVATLFSSPGTVDKIVEAIAKTMHIK